MQNLNDNEFYKSRSISALPPPRRAFHVVNYIRARLGAFRYTIECLTEQYASLVLRT